MQDPHSQTGTHGCLTRHLIFTIFGVAKGLWDLLLCLPPLVLPMLHMGSSAGTAHKGFEPTAGVSNRNSPLAGFPGLPYGSRCLEFELWAEPGGKSSGWLCHPSNVPAKQGSAAKRNFIPPSPASTRQLRLEHPGSDPTPRPAGDALSAFLLPCVPRLPPPSRLEGRELWGCAPHRPGCAFRRWLGAPRRAPQHRVMEGSHTWQPAAGFPTHCTSAVQSPEREQCRTVGPGHAAGSFFERFRVKKKKRVHAHTQPASPTSVCAIVQSSRAQCTISYFTRRRIGI